MSEDNSLDILGLKPYGEAVNTLAKGAVEGAGAFLSKVCMPASEELGLLFRDKISNWRKKNAIKVVEKFENKFNALPDAEGWHAHPRIATLGLERGSWADSDEVQEMWAGLLTSSCTKDGNDDSNLIFLNLLEQLTVLQATILNYACRECEKIRLDNGLIDSETLIIKVDDLISLTKIKDVHHLDRELDYLRTLGLIKGGFTTTSSPLHAKLDPTPLGLNFYVRCQGSLLTPIEFFGLSEANTEMNLQ